jgi:hypothetical protein
MRIFKRGLTAAGLAVVAPLAGQQTGPPGADTLPVYVLEPVVVEGRLDDLTRVAVTASQGLVGYQDLRLRPLGREGEVLEAVPGLIMTQHSGDGKANQMFVRGFSLDHGTDFSTKIEGMQVNIPTHAHGQGYTDLNFIIPELVDHVDYRLGTYYAEIGDFGAAGGAHLRLRRSLSRPLVSASLGEHGFRRLVAAASRGGLLAGGELKDYDGPWAIDEELRKLAGMLRYSWERGEQLFSVLALGYDNRWNSSDQIPGRLVEEGVIDRLSQVDSTLGGSSSRVSLSASWMRSGTGRSQRIDVYGILYDLELHSNFTYFLDHPGAGDQIRQEDEGRKVLGANFAHVQPLGRHEVTVGVQTRADLLDVALRRTARRRVVGTVRADEATEWGTGLHAELESVWSPLLRTVLGVRGDYYRFDVTSDREANSGTASDGIVSPKASVVFTPAASTELYLSGGLGFHSNDARGTVQAVDPVSGGPVDPVDPLVRSRGAEVGVRLSPAEPWRTTLALWTVELDSELLFVGDAGTTEASDGSRRVGLTVTNSARIADGLIADLDVSLARARFHDLPEGENRIPGALERVVTAGITWEPEERGPFASVRLRHFGEYPLIEDNSVRAEPASLVNAQLGWRLGDLRIGVSMLNALDSEDADIQYFYASRLPGDPPEGVEDVHFHPVEPRQVRVTASWGL